jgi:hypothetical protein
MICVRQQTGISQRLSNAYKEKSLHFKSTDTIVLGNDNDEINSNGMINSEAY